MGSVAVVFIALVVSALVLATLIVVLLVRDHGHDRSARVGGRPSGAPFRGAGGA